MMKNWVNPTEKMDEWWGIAAMIYEKRINPQTLICPNCTDQTVHYFYYGKSGGRGGCWIWCSSCLSFIHTSSKIPFWWKVIEGVPGDILTPEPEWLNNNLSKWEPVLY